MANFLLVHGNRMVTGVQYPGLSSIAAHLKQAGHEFHLFDCADYKPVLAPAHSREHREMADNPVPLLFRPLEAGAKMPPKRDLARLPNDLEIAIRRIRPDVIGFSCFSDDWPFTLWLIRCAHRLFPDIPIIIGGDSCHPRSRTSAAA